MNVHISYRLHKTPAVEKDIQHQVEKLRKRLQVFRPELIHLKGMVEEISAREGTSVSLNLRLPSGQMAVQAKASTAAAAVKSAFEDLLQQVNKHKDLLRSSHKWPRRQHETSARRNISVPFEQTLAAVFPAMVSADDVRSYVNVNLSRLERFVEREIYFRETSDLVAPDSISKEEVIDETIAAALGEGDGNHRDKPERLALEPWLYRLAMKALDQLSRPEGSNGGAVHLEDSARKQNVKASDEARTAVPSARRSHHRRNHHRRRPRGHARTDRRLRRNDAPHRLRSARCQPGPSRGFHPARPRRLRRRRNLRHHRRFARPASRSPLQRPAITCANRPASSANSRGGSPAPAPHKSPFHFSERTGLKEWDYANDHSGTNPRIGRI